LTNDGASDAADAVADAEHAVENVADATAETEHAAVTTVSAVADVPADELPEPVKRRLDELTERIAAQETTLHSINERLAQAAQQTEGEVTHASEHAATQASDAPQEVGGETAADGLRPGHGADGPQRRRPPWLRRG